MLADVVWSGIRVCTYLGTVAWPCGLAWWPGLLACVPGLRALSSRACIDQWGLGDSCWQMAGHRVSEVGVASQPPDSPASAFVPFVASKLVASSLRRRHILRSLPLPPHTSPPHLPPSRSTAITHQHRHIPHSTFPNLN
jgi:hypothetical protein